MFAIRFIVLVLLVSLSWRLVDSPVHELNSTGRFIAYSFFIFAPMLYLLPTYEAWRKKHANLTAIAIINVFLGWSLVGWVVAVVWAFKKPEPALVTSPSVEIATPSRGVKNCPFCAEEILAAAVKCKHCGSNVSA